MRLLSCGCCDGTCGPNNGCNCLACQALDREEQEQKNEEAARPPPSSYIMDSWTWGPQPGKEATSLTNKLYAILTKHSVVKVCLHIPTPSRSPSQSPSV